MKKYLQMFDLQSVMSMSFNDVAPWVGAEREHKTVSYRAERRANPDAGDAEL